MDIAGIITGPILISTAGSLGTKLLGGVAKKFYVEEKGKNIRGENQEGLDMNKDNILLRKLPTPKRIQLSSGRVFYGNILCVS